MPPRKNKPQLPEHYCDDCKFKKWKEDEKYRTPEGLPIFMRCPYYRKGEVSIIRGSKACNKFQQ